MRARWLVPPVPISVALVGTRLVLPTPLELPSSSPPASPVTEPDAARPATDLPIRSVAGGPVEIAIEPIRIDGTGAVFRIVMDTYSEELSADLAGSSLLEVDGVEWARATWSGDPPGGHHRQGELAFRAEGPAARTAVSRSAASRRRSASRGG